MRELKFKISGQQITKSLLCNFNDISSGTENYLYASFSFSNDWNEIPKVAVFTKLREEYPVKIVGNKCQIPNEALTWKNFGIYVVGKKDEIKITTNKVIVEQKG